jgi:hypothetical protein
MDARRSIRCLIAAAILLGGCARVVHPPTPVPTQPRGYEIVQGRGPEVVARLRAAPAPAQPEVNDGRGIKSDEALLRGRGLVQIGIGHFDDADPAQARARAVRTGRDVGADAVMIYPTLSEGLTAAYYVRLRLPFGASFRDLTEDERSKLGASGVQIGEVVGGTPADKANLLEGDFVLKFNHQPVQDKPSFQALLEQHMGKKVALTIRRDGMTLERSVRLGTLAESGHN